ncbi:MAG: hypothetical protein AAF192_08845 [Pseudomonadota bacterium]
MDAPFGTLFHLSGPITTTKLGVVGSSDEGLECMLEARSDDWSDGEPVIPFRGAGALFRDDSSVFADEDRLVGDFDGSCSGAVALCGCGIFGGSNEIVDRSAPGAWEVVAEAFDYEPFVIGTCRPFIFVVGGPPDPIGGGGGGAVPPGGADVPLPEDLAILLTGLAGINAATRRRGAA